MESSSQHELKKKAPVKRDKALQPLSRDHHHSLLLCWKIRSALSKGIAVARIKKYTDWFFQNHIGPHFAEEEKDIFPILGEGHELVKKAVTEHRRIARLFNAHQDVERSLSRLEELLERHIRFEERVLFNEVQKVATPEQLQQVARHHEERFQDNIEDEFWR